MIAEEEAGDAAVEDTIGDTTAAEEDANIIIV